MKFVIITHVPHFVYGNSISAYAPYVMEMNIWSKYVDELIIVAPRSFQKKESIDCNYSHSKIKFIEINSFDVLSSKNTFLALLKIPIIGITIFKAMRYSDHIHLRCPGNIGLLGCLIQVFFPKKTKTAKYAGNWDPCAKQPLSYRFQKWILHNTFLTKNMNVLVYGTWNNQSKNIKSFFTATYSDADIEEIQPRKLEGQINFIFVGTLTKGKQPLYAIQLIEALKMKGFEVNLSIYGEGAEMPFLKHYIESNNLHPFICLKGNVSKETMKGVYKNSHFLLLPSKSEGWPKVIAEAMFWGCLPVTTSVSCVSSMLGFGSRGILLTEFLSDDTQNILQLLENQVAYEHKIKEAVAWSQMFTTNKFEYEIKKLVAS
ncbi:glycosyltransferase [Flavobacterium aciduliphilum]|uniref:Glycosyltransferase involved in cell wall biosynthesis n=1 Tax=Flavobacterium aciduliphilum TaxID=1101402 RepID=A0A328YAM9_9FLAO|nr:glycosyltransferase [Flavobacterium aciduliphilum]RAR70224.1 glycosyltransferase involved in cell wall biosynthesis [Flavobacterium aciduliphilum]